MIVVNDRVHHGANSQHSDLVLIAPGDMFAVVLEVKAVVRSRAARSGDLEKLNALATTYSHSVNQIQSTVEMFGRSRRYDFSDVPINVPTVGLIITMERHLIVHVRGTIYPGLPISVPTWDGVECKPPTPVFARRS